MDYSTHGRSDRMIRLLQDLEEGEKLPSYTLFGCYPYFYIEYGNGLVCPDCAKIEEVIDYDINWEDEDMYCDFCGEKIHSAYGEDE